MTAAYPTIGHAACSRDRTSVRGTPDHSRGSGTTVIWLRCYID